ncbi:MAG: Asp-tRNA(Asn)/Glu-tRNA(Gln) amidotransferase subunit GatC [Chlamydiales bacterium]
MSDLSEEKLRTLGRLSRLKLSEEELHKLYIDLKRVTDYIDLLNEVDVSDLNPFSHMDEQSYETLREDEVRDPLPREVFLDNAPDQVGGMVRVPPVMK